MKILLRAFIFAYFAIYIAQYFFATFTSLEERSFWMVLLATVLLNFFKRGIFGIVSLPTKGAFFYLLSAGLTVILLGILVSIIPDFTVIGVSTPSFNILGFVIPSIYLPTIWQVVATALIISLISDFFYWLCTKK